MMAKSKSRKDGNTIMERTRSESGAKEQNRNYDPALVSLFARSLGPVKIATRPVPWSASHPTTLSLPEASKSLNNAGGKEKGLLLETSMKQERTDPSDTGDSKAIIPSNNNTTTSLGRKRKRKDAEDDLESRYMSQLVREEVKEDQNRVRNNNPKSLQRETQGTPDADTGSSSGDLDVVANGEEEYTIGDVPRHESLIKSRADIDLDKSSRTIFLSNVSTTAIKSKRAKKILIDHLTSFISSLPPSNDRHDIESFRFRSIAFAASGIPKKAAFAKKQIMDTTTKSTNAYVVYTTQLAAREAVTRLNGSIVLDRHLRVDSVAHPAKIDHRRCVFVGNLGFVDDETNVNAARDEEISKRPRKAKEAGDVEEGLWRQFKRAGDVESVRVIRDKTTRVGKGFAYIQFKDTNSVERAILYHEKKFPPMLPRILRVTRAKNTKDAASRKEVRGENVGPTKHRPKVSSQAQSLAGRAHKLLGRAGAAKLGPTRGQYTSSPRGASTTVARSPEYIAFEGSRASSSRSQGKGTLKKAGRKHKRPTDRSKEFRTRGTKNVK